MATVTFLQLQTDTLLYADQRPGGANQHVNPTELKRLINTAAREYWDLLVGIRGREYFATSTPLSIVGNTATYNLPATLFTLLSITLEWDARTHEPVRPIDGTQSRAQYTNLGVWTPGSSKCYELRGSQSGPMVIDFLPTPASAVTARVRYVPVMTDLVNDGDTIDTVNGWDKLVTMKAAIEMLSIKGSTKQTAALQVLYEQQLQRITELAGERDASEPGQVRDVDPECDFGLGRNWYVS